MPKSIARGFERQKPVFSVLEKGSSTKGFAEGTERGTFVYHLPVILEHDLCRVGRRVAKVDVAERFRGVVASGLVVVVVDIYFKKWPLFLSRQKIMA